MHVTTLMDNSSDVLLPDEGLVRRWGLNGTSGPLPVVPAEFALGGSNFDVLRAEHGFSALIEVRALAAGLPGACRPNSVGSCFEL